MATLADLPFLTTPPKKQSISLTHDELKAIYDVNPSLAEKFFPIYDPEKQTISIKKLGRLTVGERVALENLIAEQASLNSLRMELGVRIAKDFGISLNELDQFMRDKDNQDVLSPYLAELVRLQSLESSTEFQGLKIVSVILGRAITVTEEEVSQLPTEVFSRILEFAQKEFNGDDEKPGNDPPASEAGGSV